MLTVLERIVPVAPGRSTSRPDDYEALQRISREIAFEGGWSRGRADKIRELFDRLAPEWHTRGGPERGAPVADALARGGVGRSGLCVEVGSGTGIQTPVLAAHFDRVVAFDMAPQMLAHASQVAETVPLRLLADASRMPFRAGVANAVVCINMFLFPEEVDRVLRSDGALIFVSTIGADTPIYLQPGDVLDALPGSWDGTTSDACWGTWTVARRS